MRVYIPSFSFAKWISTLHCLVWLQSKKVVCIFLPGLTKLANARKTVPPRLRFPWQQFNGSRFLIICGLFIHLFVCGLFLRSDVCYCFWWNCVQNQVRSACFIATLRLSLDGSHGTTIQHHLETAHSALLSYICLWQTYDGFFFWGD